MPISLERPEPLPAGAEEDIRLRWTRRACQQLLDAGIVDLEKYELLGGELVRRVKNRRHINALNLMLTWLAQVFEMRFVQSQDPIAVAPADNEHNAPEPDAAVTRAPVVSYREADPGPEDLRLVVEVTDSTQRRDKGTKAELYARAGIDEYWLLDLPARRLRVHRDPDPDTAAYRDVQEYAEDETLAPRAAPSASVRVGDLLP